VHLRLGAGAAVEIGVAANRGKIRVATSMVRVDFLAVLWSASGEVMLGKGGRAAHAVIMLRAVASAHVIVAVARVEGRRIGCLAGDTWDAGASIVRHGWLPVNGVQAVLEAFGGLELPLSDDCPDDGNKTDRSCNGNKDDNRGFRDLAGRPRSNCRRAGSSCSIVLSDSDLGVRASNNARASGGGSGSCGSCCSGRLRGGGDLGGGG